jgi:hypothetical protein
MIECAQDGGVQGMRNPFSPLHDAELIRIMIEGKHLTGKSNSASELHRSTMQRRCS